MNLGQIKSIAKLAAIKLVVLKREGHSATRAAVRRYIDFYELPIDFTIDVDESGDTVILTQGTNWVKATIVDIRGRHSYDCQIEFHWEPSLELENQFFQRIEP